MQADFATRALRASVQMHKGITRSSGESLTHDHSREGIKVKATRIALILTAVASLMAVGLPQGQAVNADTTPDITKLPWSPTPDLANLDNWETYNAYNVNHFVSTQLGNRQPGDTSALDGLGEPNPQCKLGDTPDTNCAVNHQLEYLNWWEGALRGMLGDFGVTFRTYPFTSPGSAGLAAGIPPTWQTNSGSAFNKLAIIPGAEHPEDFVLIGSHFDNIDGSPFAAWDSTAGSGVMLRVAKYLADYWKATGTRPSKSYVFAVWDAEEAGTVGSGVYIGTQNSKSAQNGILPKDPNVQLTSYLNEDPCGGHYPAMWRGIPVGRQPLVEKSGFIPAVISLHAAPTGGGANNGTAAEKAHMAAFNNSVPSVFNQIFNYVDDTLSVSNNAAEPGVFPVFLSKEEATALGSEALEQESVLKITTKPLILFGTDAENFHRWIPILNMHPDNVGPHNPSANPTGAAPQDVAWGADGLWQYHSPLDTFEELVRQTSADQTGLGYSKGLAMSWEFCALKSAWVMIQPTQGGLAAADNSVVAFFENDNPNVNGGTHTFDASGSYMYTDVTARTVKRGDDLEYSWDLGDGTTRTGRVVTHEYGDSAAHLVTLTVTDPATGASDSMQLKIGVGAL